jgi:hypothetical protein
MNYSPILVPVVALVAWTLLVMFWMALTRIPAMKKAGIDLATRRGGRGANLEGVIPDEVNWKAHNYQHLLEQPTIFYAIAIVLALMEMGGGINYLLAWAYVGFRVIHSLVQSTVNIVKYRLLFFVLSSACLIGLTMHAVLRIIHDCFGG